MTSAPKGGVGVAQSMTKTDVGEGGGQSDSDIIIGTPMTDNLNDTNLSLTEYFGT